MKKIFEAVITHEKGRGVPDSPGGGFRYSPSTTIVFSIRTGVAGPVQVVI